ncbi:peptidylprolyl isomerase [Fodinisporobacter ferrooxydans]|uniref:Peptidyl-prolyl cis-trans isomerase n=1 Tax=Fodinisporobacter ferrooxydans TaxID=2901836 RepID=A0ABY4CM98_9BACL|nr:peptidylprolyl isomerase [Alicyclobacillaceae bacterium MYW30-H2]
MKPYIRVASSLLVAGLLGISFITGCGASTTPSGQTPAGNTAKTDSNSSNAAKNPNATTGQKTATDQQQKSWSKPPAMTIDVNKTYDAVIQTNLGSFTIELLPKEAPVTVNNFVFLANQHFYDNIKFHRIIKSFMIQTGDPKGDGTGGPGYTFKDELPPKERYQPGIVAMANAGPNTNGSQFFICTGPDSEGLNQTPNYTIFGKVIQGMDVVQKIASVPVGPSPTGKVSAPKVPVYMKSVKIETK